MNLILLIIIFILILFISNDGSEHFNQSEESITSPNISSFESNNPVISSEVMSNVLPSEMSNVLPSEMTNVLPSEMTNVLPSEMSDYIVSSENPLEVLRSEWIISNKNISENIVSKVIPVDRPKVISESKHTQKVIRQLVKVPIPIPVPVHVPIPIHISKVNQTNKHKNILSNNCPLRSGNDSMGMNEKIENINRNISALIIHGGLFLLCTCALLLYILLK